MEEEGYAYRVLDMHTHTRTCIDNTAVYPRPPGLALAFIAGHTAAPILAYLCAGGANASDAVIITVCHVSVGVMRWVGDGGVWRGWGWWGWGGKE